jgi:transcriptional regulator with XRE-family HTH domain
LIQAEAGASDSQLSCLDTLTSLAEMLKDSGAEKELLNAVEDVRHQQVTNALAKMRVAKGLTQKQLADSLGCTQGRISKLETGRDEDLTLKDVLDYARATEIGLQIGIGCLKSLPKRKAPEIEVISSSELDGLNKQIWTGKRLLHG